MTEIPSTGYYQNGYSVTIQTNIHKDNENFADARARLDGAIRRTFRKKTNESKAVYAARIRPLFKTVESGVHPLEIETSVIPIQYKIGVETGPQKGRLHAHVFIKLFHGRTAKSGPKGHRQPGVHHIDGDALNAALAAEGTTGKVLKIRFVKIGEAIMEEYTQKDQPRNPKIIDMQGKGGDMNDLERRVRELSFNDEK